MSKPASRLALPALLLAAPLGLGLSSCASDGVTVSGNMGMYYGNSFYDPWFYGPGYRPPLIVGPPVRPPPVPPRPRPPPRPR